jgi:hypothetical protein
VAGLHRAAHMVVHHTADLTVVLHPLMAERRATVVAHTDVPHPRMAAGHRVMAAERLVDLRLPTAEADQRQLMAAAVAPAGTAAVVDTRHPAAEAAAVAAEGIAAAVAADTAAADVTKQSSCS